MMGRFFGFFGMEKANPFLFFFCAQDCEVFGLL